MNFVVEFIQKGAETFCPYKKPMKSYEIYENACMKTKKNKY